MTLSVLLQHHSELVSSRWCHHDQIQRGLILLLLLTPSLPRSLLRAPGGGGGGSTRGKRLGGRQEASTATQSSKRAFRRSVFGRCFATGACNSHHTPPNVPILFLPAIRRGLEGWYAEGPNLTSRWLSLQALELPSPSLDSSPRMACDDPVAWFR